MKAKVTALLVLSLVVVCIITALLVPNNATRATTVGLSILGILYLVWFFATNNEAPTSLNKSSENEFHTEDQETIVHKEPLDDARAAVARGDYETAITHYKTVADADPFNRLPWVEIAKIQQTNLHDTKAAANTIRTALEGHEWPINDAAYFMLRLAEMYGKELNNTDASVSILHQVIEQFPDTKHSANATHRLRDMKMI